jgi:hypothetical protein
MTRQVLTIGLGAIAVLAFGVMSFAQRVTLVANALIAVVDRAVADPGQTKVVGTIATGQEVRVLGCVDIKHYLVPQVILDNGARGFVLVGDFQLKRDSPWSLSSLRDASLAYGC